MIPLIIAAVVIGGVGLTVSATIGGIALRGKLKKSGKNKKNKKDKQNGNQVAKHDPVIDLNEDDAPKHVAHEGVDIPKQKKERVVIDAIDDLSKQEKQEKQEEKEEKEEEKEVNIPASLPIEEQVDVFEQFVEDLNGKMDNDSLEFAKLLLETANSRVAYLKNVDKMTTKIVDYAKKNNGGEKKIMLRNVYDQFVEGKSPVEKTYIATQLYEKFTGNQLTSNLPNQLLIEKLNENLGTSIEVASLELKGE